MEYKLNKGNNSNYEIVLTLTTEDLEQFKENVLKHFQKDYEVKGFRKGHVPLDMVEKAVNPEYLRAGLLEEGLHQGLQKLVEDNKKIQFIGNIYDLTPEDKDGKTILTFKLDCYPEVEVLNKNWEMLKPEPIDETVSEKEIEETITNLKKQYAKYEDIETINNECVAKLKLSFQDKDGTELDKGTTMIGPEDYDEFKIVKDEFIGKKLGDKVELKYDEKKLPGILQHKKDGKPAILVCDITEVKKMVLPEFDEKTLKEFFGTDEIKTIDDLKAKISETLVAQKKQAGLMGETDKLLEAAKASIKVSIPKTLIEEEHKARMGNLKERFGGEKGFEEYMAKVPQDQKEKMNEEINAAAKESLEKFFIFRKYTELLGIDKEINWEQQFDAETKIYDHLTKK